MVIIASLLVNSIVINPNLDSTASNDIQFSKNLDNESSYPDIEKNLFNTPTAFTENHGQLENDEVRFYDQSGGVWFTDDGVWFELREYTEARGRGSEFRDQSDFDPLGKFRELEPMRYRRVILKQEFVGATLVRPVGRGQLSWNSNYFCGNDSSKWCTEVPNYAEVYYENLYDGIDLRYYSNEKGLKYDLIVHPGANPDQIRIRYNGVDSIKVNEFGDILIHTALGDIVDGGLFCYQDIDDKQSQIDGRFNVIDNLVYGFKLTQDYNLKEDLIIDPVLFSTYLGGTGWDGGNAIAVDNFGNSYITGSTSSSDFPTTQGAYGQYLSSWSGDVFVSKLNQYGSKLLYSTYIGGISMDYGNDIAVDLKGNSYVIGTTYSTNFPSTPSAFDPTYNEPVDNGRGDCFVLQLNHNGSSLSFSTFLGTDSYDYGYALALDSYGKVIVIGETYFNAISKFPTTTGAYSATHSGQWDIFVTKLSSDGSTLLYSSFIGGEHADHGRDLTLDSGGNAYVTGGTYSQDFPTTSGTYDNNFNGYIDCYGLKLNLSSKGTSDLKYSTYIGGTHMDWGTAITLDSSRNIIITGSTKSTDFPVTMNAFDDSYNGDSGSPRLYGDSFVIKLNTPYSKLDFSTYIGGINDEWGSDIRLDSKENVIISGITNSLNFPITIDAYDIECNNTDGFFSKLSSDGSELIYSSFLGGEENDYANGMWYDNVGILYITGNTESTDFPTTTGAFCNKNKGYNDTFVFVISLLPNFNFTSISLLDDEVPTNIIYARLKPYTLRVKLVNTFSTISDLKDVKLTLDPDGTNIQLFWDRSTNQFTKLSDPENFITLQNSSKATNIFYWWTIDFNITFNWTYPNENLNDLQSYGTSETRPPIHRNITRNYHIENDIIFNGTLNVKGEDYRIINENDLIRGGEELNWSGLRVVYENTNDVFPPEEEYDISIWDSIGNSWVTSTKPGEFFSIETTESKNTNLDGELYIVNITEIPVICDASNTSFSIRIDGDNVSFLNAIPDNQTWHTDNAVNVGISIADSGGGLVKGENVMYALSTNNGQSYNEWIKVPHITDNVTLNVQTIATFKEGKDNLIKWRAIDTLGNGPTESEPYNVLVDTISVHFSNPVPSSLAVSPTHNVEIGIDISDNLSGVNASSIEYSTSLNGGFTWDPWQNIPNYEFQNRDMIYVKFNLSFPNGTDNRIRWRAYDIAGNGPTKSKGYKIEIWAPNVIPKIRLLSPNNNTFSDSTTVDLMWELTNQTIEEVIYDIYFDVTQPPSKLESNYTETIFTIENLTQGESYYWAVIPKIYDKIGSCISGIWSFKVVPYKPKVKLFSPKNSSTVQSLNPTLYWIVDYEGFEEITYDVYIDTDINLTNRIKVIKSPKYTLENDLKDGKTYFWKIVPRIDKYLGENSGVWSFTIDMDYGSRFDLNLSIIPTIIELSPGETSFVEVSIVNLGKSTDKLILNSFLSIDSSINVTIMASNIAILDPNIAQIFKVSLIVDNDAEYGEVKILFEVMSETALDLGLEVSRNATLSVIIVEKPESPQENNFWIILQIIIIIIIIIISIYLIVRRKKKRNEERLTELKNSKPSLDEQPAPPKPSIGGDQKEQLPVTQGSEQLPKTIGSGMGPQLQEIPSPSVQPQLPAPKSEQVATVVPQLPPGKVEKKENIHELDKSEGGQISE